MPDRIEYKAYYEKEANASKLKEADYEYVSQPKADHQGSKIRFAEFQWLGSYIIEKVSSNVNHLVRKIATNKTQVLHRMQMHQFTPRRPPPDTRITPQEWTPDPEVMLTHDDLYARSWECEYETPIFDAENKNATPPNSPENPVQSDLSTEETKYTPGTPQESSPENLLRTAKICDVIDAYPYM